MDDKTCGQSAECKAFKVNIELVFLLIKTIAHVLIDARHQLPPLAPKEAGEGQPLPSTAVTLLVRSVPRRRPVSHICHWQTARSVEL
jgi:hypothetical protein